MTKTEIVKAIEVLGNLLMYKTDSKFKETIEEKILKLIEQL